MFQIIAEAETTSTDFHATFGEWAVTISGLLLAVATIAVGVITYFLIKVSRELVEATKADVAEVSRANRLAMKTIGAVTTNANDDMRDTAVASIHAAERGRH